MEISTLENKTTRVSQPVKKSFNNYSEEAQEIINRKPDFFERFALVFLIGILILLFGASWFIQYPDIVQTRASLSAYNGPKPIFPFQTGRLVKLFFQRGDQIKKGDIIGWVENTADAAEVLKLSTQLDSSEALLTQQNFKQISKLFNTHYNNLGMLQTAYQSYITSLQQFNDYMVNGFYLRKKNMILNDLNTINQINNALSKQEKLTQQDGQLSEDAYKMNEKLYKEKVISLDEYRQQQSKLLNKQMAIPQIRSSILANKNAERDKLKDLEQLEHDMIQQKVLFEQSLQTLKSQVANWKHLYLLIAPLNGKIYFTTTLQENQIVEQGHTIGYVYPDNSKFFAQLYLPQYNLGKIEVGMKVQLRFDAYPYEQVGFVNGRLNYISHVGSDSGYLATVELPNGLKTNLNQTLQFKNGLSADAMIITKNMNLLKRLFYMIIKATSVGS